MSPHAACRIKGPGLDPGRESPTAEASPARRLSAAGSRSWIDACAGCRRKRPLLCRLPHADRPFPALAGERRKRFRLLSLFRRFNPEADDPLFRPVDADDFRTNGENANDFSDLRQNGLIRITFDLPPNIRLIDSATNLPSGETRVDVWPMVPTVNDVKLTGDDFENPWFRAPNPTGGYQLDGRFADLQEQALRALEAHAQVQNMPSQRLLNDSASFQRVLFTNERVRALSDAISDGTFPLPDPDPALDELETQGKAVFVRACAQCHGGPRQSTTPFPMVRYHDILTQCPAAAPESTFRVQAVPDAPRSEFQDVRD